MSLHNEIMNLPTRFSRGEFENEVNYLRYKEGHRDARHAAAEVALKGDKAIDLLRYIGDYYLDEIPSEDLVDKIKGFLGEVQ